jgi:hypothetical protein
MSVPTSLSWPRCELRLVQGLPDVLVIGEVAAAPVRAAMGKNLRLVDVQTIGRRDVAVGVDDHRGLLKGRIVMCLRG